MDADKFAGGEVKKGGEGGNLDIYGLFLSFFNFQIYCHSGHRELKQGHLLGFSSLQLSHGS
jgi:hypothetical protein